MLEKIKNTFTKKVLGIPLYVGLGILFAIGGAAALMMSSKDAR